MCSVEGIGSGSTDQYITKNQKSSTQDIGLY